MSSSLQASAVFIAIATFSVQYFFQNASEKRQLEHNILEYVNSIETDDIIQSLYNMKRMEYFRRKHVVDDGVFLSNDGKTDDLKSQRFYFQDKNVISGDEIADQAARVTYWWVDAHRPLLDRYIRRLEACVQSKACD